MGDRKCGGVLDFLINAHGLCLSGWPLDLV